MELGGVIQTTTSVYHGWLLRVLYKVKKSLGHSTRIQTSGMQRKQDPGFSLDGT